MSYTHVGLPKLVVGLGTHVGSAIAVRALERLLPLVFYPKHCCCAMAVVALRMPSATGVLGSMLGSRLVSLGGRRWRTSTTTTEIVRKSRGCNVR